MKNNTISEKYDFKPKAVRGKSFESDLCRMKNVFHQLIRVKKDIHRKVRRSQKIDTRKRNKLRVPLDAGEKVLVLAGCARKNMLWENSTRVQQRTGISSEENKYTLLEKEQKQIIKNYK